jgi:GNAT superfamily N-acetyltransferase
LTACTLRPALEGDKAFIFEAYKATLQPYVEWAWGWNEAFQRNGFWQHHPLDKFQVITMDGKTAGGLYTEEQVCIRFIRLIFLQSEFQNLGIGSKLLRQEAVHAAETGKQLQLKVIKINPAKKLYERLGFEVFAEDEHTYHMRLLKS